VGLEMNVGAARAAQHLLNMVEKKMVEHWEKPEVMEVLAQVAEVAKEIITACDGGYY
jgi:hypothetical protein